jgi:hypothetical protein
MRVAIAILCSLTLAACTIAEPKPVDGVPIADCRNEPLGQFIGQSASQELGARLLAASGARTIRWVPKGGAVTMDFRADRLTVQLDGANRIESAQCG